MMKIVYWSIFINTKDKTKAVKICNRLLKILGNECIVITLEQYWKDDKLYSIEVKQLINVETSQLFVFELLSKLSLISRTWSINIPANYDNENFNFSGLTNDGICLSGIHWISFSIE